jgi:RNA polymerase sigma factor FliA
VTRRAPRRLWARYLAVRGAPAAGIPCEQEPRSAQREARILRERLVVAYLPLVRYVAGRVISGHTTYNALEYEEVISSGVSGLLDAVETYDPARGTKFESYAISKIRWSILDELRKADPLSRRLRALARRVEDARAVLAQRYRRAPTEAEVARELGVGLPEHREFLERCRRVQLCSLEGRQGGPDGPPCRELVPDPAETDPAATAEMAEVRAHLSRALRTLGERERVVTTRYFYEGLTLREIGDSLSLTEGRISQILRRALGELRAALADGSPGSRGGDPARSLHTRVLTSPGPENR